MPVLLLPARAATGLLMARAAGEEKAPAMLLAMPLKGVIKKLSPAWAVPEAVNTRPSSWIGRLVKLLTWLSDRRVMLPAAAPVKLIW